MAATMFAYRIITLSLAAATQAATPIPGLDPGVPITSVLMLTIPSGSQGDIRLGGSSNDPVPFVQGLSVLADPCQPIIGGIYYDNPAAQPGTSVVLFVIYGGGGVSLAGAL